MRAVLRVACVLAVVSVSAPAWAVLSGDWATRNLTNNCRSLGLEVSGGKMVAEPLKKRIRDAAELKMRTLGIWSDTIPDQPTRWLGVEIFYGAAIVVRTVVYRGTPDTGNGDVGFVIVWEQIGIIPWPQSDTDMGVDDVAEAHLDSFALAYMKANPHCR